jgi:5-methylcytosine-specific restriction endonuclease McrA
VGTRQLLIDGVWVSDPRNSRAWRRLRDGVVRDEPTCRLRFAGICTVVSTTADHIIPVSVRPELCMVRSNLRGACAECNTARRSVPDESLLLGGTSDALNIFRK